MEVYERCGFPLQMIERGWDVQLCDFQGRYSAVFICHYPDREVPDSESSIVLKYNLFHIVEPFALTEMGREVVPFSPEAEVMEFIRDRYAKSPLKRHFLELLQVEVDPDFRRTLHFLERQKRHPELRKIRVRAPRIAEFLMLEWVNGGDLHHFYTRQGLRKWRWNKEETVLFWEVVTFQLVFALGCLQTHFEGFRHNDLTSNNIFIEYKCQQEQQQDEAPQNGFRVRERGAYEVYSYKACTFRVPDIGIVVKIGDFGLSEIPSLVTNSIVESNKLTKYGVHHHANPYYDLHTFYNALHLYTLKGETDPDLETLLYQGILPPHLRGMEGNHVYHGRLSDDSVCFTTVDDILLRHRFRTAETDVATETPVYVCESPPAGAEIAAAGEKCA